jgi:nucleotide-binding universal stress UspA family protein
MFKHLLVPVDGRALTDRAITCSVALARQLGASITGFVAEAEAQGCDMIVMVTHGRGASGEFLFGSQTKAVLAGSKLSLRVLH